jgi:Mitochondrial domain of unknown function (DUF1713)
VLDAAAALPDPGLRSLDAIPGPRRRAAWRWSVRTGEDLGFRSAAATATLDAIVTRARTRVSSREGPFMIGPARAARPDSCNREGCRMGSVVKKRRKRMAKKKHRKLLRKTRVQRRRLGK